MWPQIPSLVGNVLKVAATKACHLWRRPKFACAGALACLFLTACGQPPEFVASLSDSGVTEVDPRIFGNWHDPTDGDILVKIRKGWGSGENRYTVRIDAISNNGIPVGLSFDAHASSIDGELYYNVKRRVTEWGWDYTAPDEKPGYIILRVFYLTPDAMLVCGLLALPKGSGPKSWRTWLKAQLEGTGLSPRFAEVSPTLNGRKPRESKNNGMLHTVVEGSRDDLINFATSNPAENFRAMLILLRIGSTDPLMQDKTALRSLAREHDGECKSSSMN